MYKKTAFVISALIVVLSSCSREHILFSEGKSDYCIVIQPNASESEKFAATELQNALLRIGGVELPVISNQVGVKGPKIILGDSSRDAKDESFTYKNRGADILIYGGSQRGTMYGVFSFLEKEFGVRWYTSKYSVFPQKNSFSFTRLYNHEEPGIAVRNVFFYDSFDPVWAAHNRCNGSMSGRLATAPGGTESFHGCHTFGQYVPVREYYATHPEYFNLLDGKRVDGSVPYTTQLCLTNPDVLQLCIEGVKKTMREHPEAMIVDLSQNDSGEDLKECCQCEQCRAIAQQYGGQSGLILWFVNQVADAVKEEFPDRYVGTFAYRFSRKPPVGITPRENVVVRLCSIECCFLHSFVEGCCEKNKTFYEELQQWAAIAPHLYIWDYVVTFSQYCVPYPNFNALQKNIQAFRDNKAIGVMEQGSYQSPGGEAAELRAYLLSRLLWNPDCNVDEVVNDFITGCYGAAAPCVREYYDLVQSLAKDDVHMDIYPRINNEMWNPEFIAASDDIFRRALNAVADDPETTERVEMAAFPAAFTKCLKDSETARNDGTYDLLRRVIEREGITRMSEGTRYSCPEKVYDLIEKP